MPTIQAAEWAHKIHRMDFLVCNATSQTSTQVHTAMEIHFKAESRLASIPANVTCTSQRILLNMTLFSISEETIITAFHFLPHYLPHFADTFTDKLLRSLLVEHRVKPRIFCGRMKFQLLCLSASLSYKDVLGSAMFHATSPGTPSPTHYCCGASGCRPPANPDSHN